MQVAEKKRLSTQCQRQVLHTLSQNPVPEESSMNAVATAKSDSENQKATGSGAAAQKYF
jgi:hypothetical protein